MFRHLRTKLTFLYAGLFGVALILVSAAVYLAISHNAKRLVRDELRASSTVFDRLWEMRGDRLKDGATLLSRDFGFRAAIASRDAPTIRSALDNLRDRLGLDLAVAVDPAGIPTAASGGVQLAGAAAAWGTLDPYRPTSGIVEIGGTPYQATAMPILSPVLAGWVVFAVKLDGNEMSALERLSAIPLDAAVFYRADGHWRSTEHRIAAKDQPAFDRFIDAAFATRIAAPRELDTASVASLALVKPLHSIGKAEHSALLIRYPLARALAPYRPLFGAIVTAGLLGMLLLCVGSWALARSLTRPISALDDATRRLQRGETVSIAVATQDEIGRLAHSFNTMAADIGERERQITHLALHDPETDLPNRTAFERGVAALMETASGKTILVAALGIDRFEHIRGAIGYGLASSLIGEVGGRLAEHLGASVVGRLATNALGIAFPAESLDDGRMRAEIVLSAIAAPVRLANETVDVSATAGLAAFGIHAASVADLIERANIALDQARTARRKLAVFDQAAYGDPASNLSLISDMLESIASDRMTLHHQPKYDLRLGRVTAVEALVRWNHPKRGMLFPGLFIGMAEETGHIAPLTHWVLRQAIADQAVLRRAGHSLKMSVNLSGRLLTDLDFAHAARDAVLAAQADICFEITETAVIENPEIAHQVIAEFRAAGIEVSIDDYGSGLSSLAYLKTIRAHELKIDKEFVLSLSDSTNDALLVKSTVDLAHGLGLKVTAEGVETATALALLSTMGCDYAQGYFIAKPMPLDDLVRFLTPEEAMTAAAENYAGFARGA
jgi:EAL domain-containing protein (putative c-di-GMP-specific phosphodiesterase class I)/GGDEF domain-containing protein